MDPATGAVIGAGISAVGGAQSNLMNWRQADINRQFQRDMYWQQRKHADQDWRRAAEYNDPKNVVKRMRAAGINPMLAYGKGISQQSAPPSRSSQAGTGSVARLDNPYSQIPAAMAQAGQLKVNQQQLKLNADLNQANVIAKIAGAVKDKAVAKDIITMLGYKVENIQSQTALNNARTDLTTDQLITQAQDRRLALNRDEREYLRLNSDLSKALSEINKNRAQELNYRADTQLKGAQRQVALQQVKYYNALADYTGGRAQSQFMDNVLKKFGIHDKNSTKYVRASILAAEELSHAKFDNKMHITNGKEIKARIVEGVKGIANSWDDLNERAAKRIHRLDSLRRVRSGDYSRTRPDLIPPFKAPKTYSTPWEYNKAERKRLRSKLKRR